MFTKYDILIISQRGLCVSCRRKLFLRLTADGAIDHSGGNERHLLGNELRSSYDVALGFVSCVLRV